MRHRRRCGWHQSAKVSLRTRRSRCSDKGDRHANRLRRHPPPPEPRRQMPDPRPDEKRAFEHGHRPVAPTVSREPNRSGGTGPAGAFMGGRTPRGLGRRSGPQGHLRTSEGSRDEGTYRRPGGGHGYRKGQQWHCDDNEIEGTERKFPPTSPSLRPSPILIRERAGCHTSDRDVEALPDNQEPTPVWDDPERRCPSRSGDA